jgi:glycosyltransferase involved in cell wall biosynthesis
MGSARVDGITTLSYIVPAHNSTDVIEGSLKELGERLAGMNAEILVVENGSSDGTAELLDRLAGEWQQDVPLRVLSTPRGLGNAFRAGILASKGDRICLTADDLPFGLEDLDTAEGFDPATNPVVIGSKAHPDSVTPRSPLRQLLTFGFTTLRRLILGMRTRDPQGSFFLDGTWAREVAPRLREEGFLFTTELTYLAERGGIRPVEIPIRLRASHQDHGSRIRLSDPLKMGVGLFALRGRHRRAA